MFLTKLFKKKFKSVSKKHTFYKMFLTKLFFKKFLSNIQKINKKQKVKIVKII